MAISPIGPKIESQPLNDNFAYLNENVELAKNGVLGLGINVKYPPPPLVAAKGDGISDDTAAIKAITLLSNVIFLPEGEYLISDSIPVTSGKIFYGAGRRNSVIIMTTNNIPIIYASGEGVRISDLRLSYSSVQGSSNIWANAIHIRRLYESVIERLYIEGAAHGIYCERYSTDVSDTTENYIYSVSIRDIRITKFSLFAMYLSSINAGNTGCIFDNIYAVNWNVFQVSKYTSKGFFQFKGFSESSARQLNAEWGVFTENCYNLNSCDSFHLMNAHIEGVESTTNFKSIIEVLGGTKAKIDRATMQGCSITASDFAFCNISGVDTQIDLLGVTERDNTITATNKRPFYSSSISGSLASVRAYNVEFLGFTSSSFIPTLFPPVIKQFNDNIFYYQLNSRKQFTGTAAPTTDTWAVGDTVQNTAPTLVKNISHWKCITAGTPGVWTAYGCGTGTTANRPSLTASDAGYLYRDTTTGTLVFWNGTSWI